MRDCRKLVAVVSGNRRRLRPGDGGASFAIAVRTGCHGIPRRVVARDRCFHATEPIPVAPGHDRYYPRVYRGRISSPWPRRRRDDHDDDDGDDVLHCIVRGYFRLPRLG